MRPASTLCGSVGERDDGWRPTRTPRLAAYPREAGRALRPMRSDVQARGAYPLRAEHVSRALPR